MALIKKYGIWEVHDDFGLVGKINEGYDYQIYPERLWETDEKFGRELSNWLIHLAEKKWINKENVKDLNEAFTFSLDYFKKFKPETTSKFPLEQSLFVQEQILNFNLYANALDDDMEIIMEYQRFVSTIKFIEE